MLPALLLALVLAPDRGSAELGPDTWATLHPPTAASIVVPAWAATRTIQLTPAPGGVQLRATWTLRSLSPGAWFSGHVLGAMPGARVEQVTWDGRPVAARTTADGLTVAGRVTGTATLELIAFLPGEPTREPLAISLLPAVRGHVEVTAPAGLVPTLRIVDTPTPIAALTIRDKFSTGAARLDLGFTAAPASPTSRQTVVVARAGLGLTIGDAELRGRARLVWEVRQGTIEAVDFTASGTGPDLEISGTGVRAVQRSGDSVHVELQAPVAGRLELLATWTAPLAKTAESRSPVPQFMFTDVFRSESSLQLARDGEVEAIPELTGWTPTTAAALPTWGQGLVDGAPTAAWRAGVASSGALDLLRFVPIEGPPVVIDVAAYTIATSREGRAILRAHYEVRNERAATLRVRPPPGFEVLGVRVAGATQAPARDKDGAWHIPLQRSVETVYGVLSFPVEIGLLGGTVPWDRRERRAVQLPQLDAPIAVARVTLHLPPGYRSRLGPGDGDVVAAFTRGDGITYGLGVGSVGAAEADAVFQSAVKNWLANDFDAAQRELDNLKTMGASNENITRLQGNLDVIAGRGNSDDKGVQRRIREQAKARSIDDQRLQDELRSKADESRKSGDYEAAQSQYQAAIAVGDRLAKLEQKESIEQQSRNQSLAQELESTAGEYRSKKQVARKGKQTRFASGKSAAPISFEFDEDQGPPADPPANAKSPATATTSGPARDITTASSNLDGKRIDAPAEPVATRDGTIVDLSPAVPVAAPTSAAPRDAVGVRLAESPAMPVAAPTSGTTRDFSAVLDLRPGVTTDKTTPPDAPTIASPDGPVSAEPMPPAPAPVAEDLAVRIAGTTRSEVSALAGVAAGRRFKVLAQRVRDRRETRRVRTRDTLDTKSRVEREKLEVTNTRPSTESLPEPKVTASAVSVVVPQVGRAVLYQRLLLPADAPFAIDVSAREPLLAKD